MGRRNKEMILHLSFVPSRPHRHRRLNLATELGCCYCSHKSLSHFGDVNVNFKPKGAVSHRERHAEEESNIFSLQSFLNLAVVTRRFTCMHDTTDY